MKRRNDKLKAMQNLDRCFVQKLRIPFMHSFAITRKSKSEIKEKHLCSDPSHKFTFGLK